MTGQLHSYWIAIPLSIAFACTSPPAEDTVTIRGRVTNGDGAQTRMFGGSNTVIAAATVRGQAIGAGGALELIGEADVIVGGSFLLDVSAAQRRAIVVEVLDSNGAVVGASFVEQTGDFGETVPCSPVDTETSLEALVAVQLAALGVSPDELRIGDLRARLDSEVAVSVREAVTAGADADAIVRALAEATLAAQRVELASYAQAGVSVTARELADAERLASQELSRTLEEGGALPRVAYAQFVDAVRASRGSLGVDERSQGRTAASSEVAFRLTLRARLDSEDSAGVVDAASRASARLEAAAQSRATLAILTTGEAAADVLQAGEATGVAVVADVGLASTVAAASDAYASYRTAVRGDGAASGSLLGNYFSIGVASEAMVTGAIEASAAAAVTLDAALVAAIETSASAGGALDPATLAADFVAAFDVFHQAAAAATTSLSTLHGELAAETAGSLLIAADGSFRLGSPG